jgi:hypothetical protein
MKLARDRSTMTVQWPDHTDEDHFIERNVGGGVVSASRSAGGQI